MRSRFAVILLAATLLLPNVSDAGNGKDKLNQDKYLAKTRQQKSDKIWKKVKKDKRSGPAVRPFDAITGQLKPLFDHPGDEQPCTGQLNWTGCRQRQLHNIGNVGKVEWVDLGGHDYTGIFKGGDSGYIRLSTGGPVVNGNMIPGMGLKFLRDGMDSANFVAFNSVNGQNSYNFFEKDWSNHIPKAEGTALELASRKFLVISKFILTVGISNMATHTQDGTEEAEVIFPWKLVFKPTGEFSWPSDKYPRPYTEYLKKDIPSGSKLFDVYAWDMPEELGGTETLIAEIVTGSRLYTSKWGDNNMRFRHQRMDDDLEYHPEWKPYVARQFGGDDLEDFGWQVDSEDLAVEGDENGRSLSASQHNRRLAEGIEDGYDVMMETGGFGCPFAFLLQ